MAWLVQDLCKERVEEGVTGDDDEAGVAKEDDEAMK